MRSVLMPVVPDCIWHWLKWMPGSKSTNCRARCSAGWRQCSHRWWAAKLINIARMRKLIQPLASKARMQASIIG